MKKLIFIIIILITTLFLYGRYIEVNNIKIHNYEIKNSEISESFEELKIVHFSDILYNKKTSNLNKLKNTINNEKPDVIFFTGDLFNSSKKYTENDYKNLKKFLSSLDASLYKYAVIGDHDEKYIEKYKDILYESDFKLLNNENSLLFYKDITPINIIGISDNSNIEELLKPEIDCKYTILLTHKPDNIKFLKDTNINTVLTGHSLGGVIKIPFLGGLFKNDGAKTYIGDYYKVNNKDLYISNGIGNDKINFRLFNTPSINVYRFSNN